MVAPAQQEDRLELGDDRALDPAHDVVEALVVVVVLDPAAADVADAAIDHDHLAMVEMEQVLARAAGTSAAPRSPDRDDDDPVVGDDLDAGLAQSAEEVLAPEVDLAADGIDRQPDLDARGHLRRQRGQEGLADVARLVAVDQQVDVVGRRRDVLEHPREIPPAVEERLDGRR